MAKWKKIVHWTLLALIVIYIITGLGVTQYRIIEPLTFGLLTKAWSFKIHDNLLVPFLLALILHIYFVLPRKTK